MCEQTLTRIWVWGLPCGRCQRWNVFSSECSEYVKLTSALLSSAGTIAEGRLATNYNVCVVAGSNRGTSHCPEGHSFHPLSAHLWRSAPLTVRQERLWGIWPSLGCCPSVPTDGWKRQQNRRRVWLWLSVHIDLGRTKSQGSSPPVCLWEKLSTREQLSKHMKNTYLSPIWNTSKSHSLFFILF